METGKAQRPEYQDMITDPYAVQTGPDFDAATKLMGANIATSAGAARDQALAGMARAGVQGADTTRALSDIAGKQAYNMGLLDINRRQQMMDAINQARAQRNKFAQEQYNIDQQNYAAEQAARAGGISGMLAPGLQLGASYLGNKMAQKGGQ